jgi:hypothetical protein
VREKILSKRLPQKSKVEKMRLSNTYGSHLVYSLVALSSFTSYRYFLHLLATAVIDFHPVYSLPTKENKLSFSISV